MDLEKMKDFLILYLLLISNVKALDSIVKLNVEEINSIQYQLEINKQPIIKEKIDGGNTLTVVNKHGQEYICKMPVIELDDLHTKKEDILNDELNSIASLLKPMESAPCLVKTKDWWTYEFCYSAVIKQYHLEDSKVIGTILILGKYESEYNWSNNSESKNRLQRFHSQYYVNGTKCDLTGEPRRTEVRFHCEEGVGDYIQSVDEPESCRYVVVIATTKVCHHPYLKPQPNSVPHGISCFPALTLQQFELHQSLQERQKKLEEQKRIYNKKIKKDSIKKTINIVYNEDTDDDDDKLSIKFFKIPITKKQSTKETLGSINSALKSLEAKNKEEPIERDKEDKEHGIDDKEQDINDKEQDRKNKEQGINYKEHDIENNEQDIEDKEQDTQDKEQDIEDKGQDTQDKEQDIEDKEQDTQDKEQDIEDKEQDIEDKEQVTQDTGQDIEDKEQDIEDKEQEIDGNDGIGDKQANDNKEQDVKTQDTEDKTPDITDKTQDKEDKELDLENNEEILEDEENESHSDEETTILEVEYKSLFRNVLVLMSELNDNEDAMAVKDLAFKLIDIAEKYMTGFFPPTFKRDLINLLAEMTTTFDELEKKSSPETYTANRLLGIALTYLKVIEEEDPKQKYYNSLIKGGIDGLTFDIPKDSLELQERILKEQLKGLQQAKKRSLKFRQSPIFSHTHSPTRDETPPLKIDDKKTKNDLNSEQGVEKSKSDKDDITHEVHIVHDDAMEQKHKSRLEKSIKERLQKSRIDYFSRKIEVKILTPNYLDEDRKDMKSLSHVETEAFHNMIVNILSANAEELEERDKQETLEENYNYNFEDLQRITEETQDLLEDEDKEEEEEERRLTSAVEEEQEEVKDEKLSDNIDDDVENKSFILF